MTTSMQDCPLWDRCSANICPLDPKWHRRVHDKSDPICRILTESAKPGSEARFEAKSEADEYLPRKAIWLTIKGECDSVSKEIFAKHPDIKARVLAAASTGSSFEKNAAAGERLKKWRDEQEDEQI